MTRIAMWCAPRTISTALMRAWENRPDTVVIDEPFYAHYLQATGMDHPGRDDIIASYEADWRIVARTLTEDPCRRARRSGIRNIWPTTCWTTSSWTGPAS